MRIFVITLALMGSAAAQENVVSKPAPQVDGKNEVSTQLGFQASLGGTTPAGVRLDLDYARKLSEMVWLDFQVAPVFAVGPNRAICTDRGGGFYDCGSGAYGDGYALDVLGGIKLKFPIARLPQLIPYVRGNLGVAAIFARPTTDNGAALVFRTGAGLKYFVTKHVGIGGELDVSLGPAWYSETCGNCNNAHDEFYRAIDFSLGAEFVM